MTFLTIWLGVGALGIVLLHGFILYFNHKELHIKIGISDVWEIFATTIIFTALGFVGFIITFGIFVFGSFVLWEKHRAENKNTCKKEKEN